MVGNAEGFPNHTDSREGVSKADLVSEHGRTERPDEEYLARCGETVGRILIVFLLRRFVSFDIYCCQSCSSVQVFPLSHHVVVLELRTGLPALT